MKFYYKDQLVRTSKNHHYTHAVIRVTEKGFSTFACASSRELAERARANEINWFDSQARRLRKHIEAIEQGKSEYYDKGRYYKALPNRIDELKRYVEENDRIVAEMERTLKIVEIEER